MPEQVNYVGLPDADEFSYGSSAQAEARQDLHACASNIREMLLLSSKRYKRFTDLVDEPDKAMLATLLSNADKRFTFWFGEQEIKDFNSIIEGHFLHLAHWVKHWRYKHAVSIQPMTAPCSMIFTMSDGIINSDAIAAKTVHTNYTIALNDAVDKAFSNLDVVGNIAIHYPEGYQDELIEDHLPTEGIQHGASLTCVVVSENNHCTFNTQAQVAFSDQLASNEIIVCYKGSHPMMGGIVIAPYVLTSPKSGSRIDTVVDTYCRFGIKASPNWQSYYKKLTIRQL